MGRLIAITSLRDAASWASSVSAGGQELQPWLVNSSTTTGRLAPASAAPMGSNVNATAASAADRRRTGRNDMPGTIERKTPSLHSQWLEAPSSILPGNPRTERSFSGHRQLMHDDMPFPAECCAKHAAAVTPPANCATHR